MLKSKIQKRLLKNYGVIWRSKKRFWIQRNNFSRKKLTLLDRVYNNSNNRHNNKNYLRKIQIKLIKWNNEFNNWKIN